MPKNLTDLDDIECRLQGLVSMGFAICDAKEHGPNAPETYDPASDLLVDLLYYLDCDLKEVIQAQYTNKKQKA